VVLVSGRCSGSLEFVEINFCSVRIRVLVDTC
jgi:hypothetical protein